MTDPNVRPARRGRAGACALEDEARARGSSTPVGERGFWRSTPASLRTGRQPSIDAHVFVAELYEPVPVVVGYLVLDVEGAVATVEQVYIRRTRASSARRRTAGGSVANT